VTIRQHVAGRPTNGTWWLWRTRVFVACPCCGTAAELDHEITADGAVTPSVECPVIGCAFHDMVRLEGWDEAAFVRAHAEASS
jgi:hypothetical protein